MGHYRQMGTPTSRRLLAALLIAFAAVLALVAPATSVAAPADAASAVEPAVVQITTRIDYQQAIGTGTGTVIDPGGVVLTNYHVVAGANTITGTVGVRDYPADLVGYDRKHDIAVIQLARQLLVPRRHPSAIPTRSPWASRPSDSATPTASVLPSPTRPAL